MLGNIIVLMIFQLARALFVAEPGIGLPGHQRTTAEL
jgi:hypothetical protein